MSDLINNAASVNEAVVLNNKGKKAKKEKGKMPKAAKVIITICVILAIVFAGISISSANAKKNAALDVTYDDIQKTDVKETLTATGSIISNETSYENGQGVISQYPIKTVDVELGDEVHAGDKLFTLDMSSLESDISTQEKLLAAQKKSDANTIAGAEDSLSNAEASGNLSSNDAARSVASATEDLTKAQADLTKAQNDLADLQKKEADAKTAMDNLVGSYNSAKSDLEAKQSAYYKAQSDAAEKAKKNAAANNNANAASQADTETDFATSVAQIALSQAQATYESVSSQYNTAVSDYNTAKAAREQGEAAVETATTAVTTAQRTLDTANAGVATTNQNNSSNIKSQQNALNSAKLSSESNSIQTSAAIEKDKENLAKGIVTAETDGTVTAVNIKPGMMYAGDSAVVIDDMTGFKASLNVDEADISKVSVGQKAEIKTDATENDVLTGTVTFVSPVSTAMSQKSATTATSDTAAATTSRASYRVDITLDNKDERLRLGMTAKINIIIEESNDTLAVPSEDVSTDDDGMTYVTALIDEKETKIPVEVGVKSDYYTEIKSDKLSEKMKVVSGSNTASSASDINSEVDAVDAMY